MKKIIVSLMAVLVFGACVCVQAAPSRQDLQKKLNSRSGAVSLAGLLPMAKFPRKSNFNAVVVNMEMSHRNDVNWPEKGAIGVPLYPDLKAYALDSANDSKGRTWSTVEFTSQAPITKIIVWYRKNLPKWDFNRSFGFFMGPGCDLSIALAGVCPLVKGMAMSMKCDRLFLCKSRVKITYLKK